MMHVLESVRCHLWIRGSVQGVGFRFFAERTARRLGVSGFTRNLPDGRVEAAVEGPRDAVETFIEAVRAGPSGARVDDLQMTWEAPSGGRGFHIVG